MQWLSRDVKRYAQFTDISMGKDQEDCQAYMINKK